jgi:hypothetical protein
MEMKPLQGSFINTFISLPFLLLFGFSLFKSLHFPLHDFANSYFGAYLFSKGQFDVGIFYPYTFNLRIFKEGFPSIFASYNPNPPSTALFFIPLTLFAPFWAKFVFNIASICLFCASLCRLSHHQGIDKRYLALIPILFFTPILNNILFGQSYLLLFSLLAEGYMAHENKQYVLSSILWAMAIFLKVFPVILILFLLFKKEWKAFFYLSLICLFLLALCGLIQGIEIWKFYLLEVLPQNSQGRISAAYLVNFQSFYMLFKYLFVKETILNPSPPFDSPFMFHFSILLTKIVLLSFCCSLIYRKPSLLSLSVLFLGALLILPYSSTYSNILLISLFISSLNQFRRRHFFFISCLIFLLSNIKISYFSTFPLPFQFPRLFLGLGLFLYIYFLMEVSIPWKWILGLFLGLLPAIKWSVDTPSNETLLLKKDLHALIVDFYIKDSILNYVYWDENGLNNYQTSIRINPELDQKAIVVNGQIIFKNKQLTFSSDRKLKPMILKDKIIYLSDRGRGMGFYTLWYFPLKFVK